MTDRDDIFPDPTRVVGSGGGGTAPDDLKGSLLDGRYRIERKLGEGGMATVWLARDEKPGMDLREVAVKVPHAALLAAPQARERFEREVRSLVRMEHPGVVKVHDVGRLGETPCLVMQYLPGGSLGQRLAGKPRRRQTAKEVLAWLAPLAATLDSLHAEGLVHRDVKPDNVMFDARGHPYLADFGISKALQAGDGTLTGTGVALGSVGTMAPEQCLGGAITGAADQYALASTVYEALAGRPVFEGENPLQVLTKKASQDAPPIGQWVPDLPAAAAAAVMRALARDPEARHASCGDLARAFREGLEAAPTGSFPKGLGLALVLVAILLLAAAAFWRVTREGKQGGGRSEAAHATPVPAPPPSERPRPAPTPEPEPPAGVARELLSEPAEGAWLATRAVPVSGDASGLSSVRVNGRAVPVTRGAFSTVVTAAADGPFVVRVTGDDDTVLTERTVHVDATPPVIVITVPTAERFTSREPVLKLTGRVTEANLAWLMVGDQPITPDADGNFTWPVTLAEDAETTVAFKALDRAGNMAAPVTRTLRYEKPAEAWEAPYAGAEAAGRKGDWREASRLLEEAVSKGIASGAIAEWLRRGAADWKDPPTLEVTSPTEGARIEGTVVRVSGTLSTKRPSDRLFVNGRPQEVAQGRFEVEFDYREPADYVLEVTVKDGEEERAKATRRFTLTRPVSKVPAWAKVSAEQIALAEELGVEVAFESRAVPGMHFVLVPGGTFWMGSATSEKDRDDDEDRHRVTLSRPFYVQVTEVTNEQYRRKERTHDSGHYEGQGVDGAAQPAVNVSWSEAASYADWLSRQEQGRQYHLPTEAQWEYACRAGSESRFWWGESETQAGRFANVADRTAKRVWRQWEIFETDDGMVVTAPVGTYEPNAWGLYDTLGNAWEWCLDWYGAYPRAAGAADPSGPAFGTARVLRGGSWYDVPNRVRVANRNGDVPGARDSSFGFRLVSPLPPRGR